MEQALNSLKLEDKVARKFKIYYDFLVSENEKYNLTSITDIDEVYVKHFYDSVYGLNYFDFNGKSLCDVGSGAGFPGIPLKLVNNKIKLTIIEPTQKRVNFLIELCKKLGLDDVEIICDRAEHAVLNKRESFDFVCARAVSNLRVLLELTTPLLKVGGSFIAYKGSNYEEELVESKNALKALNLLVSNTYEYELPNELGKRCLIEVKKTKKTDLIYPREYAKIKKKPL